MASSALRQALNKQDDVLGPWVPGRDPLEDALAAYAGMLSALFLCTLIKPENSGHGYAKPSLQWIAAALPLDWSRKVKLHADDEVC